MTPGWPRALVPPQHEAFEERAVAWLLDQGPAELRQSVLRQYPVALAVYLQAYVTGALGGVRLAYGQARTELAPVLDPKALEIAQQAIAAEGARLVALVRELDLVVAALQRR
ncbi:MAG: hypothetical protein WC005_08680 [Candidatus Nanopelagicales bacterium]